ncbi:replicative DNA helicase [uncultured Helicobacter sp.]|uniref:replicative DNA helicase n=1 Tax=uncultured Helicobacter sp. TaxID=175537 RepID=UPI00374E85D3
MDTIINIERAVLSAILYAPSNYEEVAAFLNPKDFLYPTHKNVFEVMRECDALNLPLDEQIILQRSQGKVREEEIVEIASASPIANIEAYTKEIKEAALKRELQELANLLREKSLDSHISSQEIMEIVEKRVSDIALGNTNGKDFIDSPTLVADTMSYLLELKNRGNEILTGVTTGFYELNDITTGFNNGDLVIIGARPSMGKTAFMLSIAQSILHTDVGVAIFSLEMPALQLMIRLLSSLSSISMQNLRRGNLNDAELEQLSICTDTMEKKELFIDDGSVLNIAQLRSKLRKLKRQHPNVGIAMIDYLQLMVGDRNQGKQIEISDISRGLKTLARELQMPIIALSQLNRELEKRDDKRPILSDLRDSGAIEQDADMILFLYRDDVYKKRADKERKARLEKEGKGADFKPEYEERDVEPAEVIVAKNRNGETKTIKIQFRKRFTRFENPNKTQEEHSDTKLDHDEIKNIISSY